MKLQLVRPTAFAINGKIASGKDTVGKALIQALGLTDAAHTSFAAALKREVTQMINLISEDLDMPADLRILQLATSQGVTLAQAGYVYDSLVDEIRAGQVADAYTRTPGVRRVLQFWGTDVRRAQDDNYWVKKTLAEITPILATGRSTIITDARFRNEADSLHSVGGYVVRLDVSRETQVARLAKRDGLELTTEQENHPSEKDLDDYPNFNLRIQADDLTPEQIVQVIIADLIALGRVRTS